LAEKKKKKKKKNKNKKQKTKKQKTLENPEGFIFRGKIWLIWFIENEYQNFSNSTLNYRQLPTNSIQLYYMELHGTTSNEIYRAVTIS